MRFDRRTVLSALLLAAPLLALPARGQEVLRDSEVSNPVWGIRFSAPAYEVWKDHPLRDQPNLVAAGTWKEKGCGLNLSLFAILVEAGTSPAACRAGFIGNPERLRGHEDIVVHAVEDEPVAWTLFDQHLAKDVAQNQLYGYLVRDESCFELHVSSISCDGFRELALPILESLALEPRPDVNLETVAVGRSLGLEPSDWKVHQILANEYLHNASPANPARARAYYENALRLSQNTLGFDDAWTIHEGIGLAWLAEDDGNAAIGALRKALDLCRSEPSNTEAMNETLYNLACAYSLSDDREKACSTAAELIGRLSGAERGKELEDMRQDPQLDALRKARCIDGL